MLTVGVRVHEIQVPFGVVECDDARVMRLKEKPSLTLLVNAGIYLLEPSACDYIPGGRRFDMTDLIRRLLEEEQVVASFPIIEYWQDVGRHEDYRRPRRTCAMESSDRRRPRCLRPDSDFETAARPCTSWRGVPDLPEHHR